MPVTTCFKTSVAGFPVILRQQGPDDFTVRYGQQVKEHLTYAQAARELGSCLMHGLACEGKLDNSEPEE